MTVPMIEMFHNARHGAPAPERPAVLAFFYILAHPSRMGGLVLTSRATCTSSCGSSLRLWIETSSSSVQATTR